MTLYLTFFYISLILFKAGRASCQISSLLWHKNSSAEFKIIKLQTNDIIHNTCMHTDLVSCSDYDILFILTLVKMYPFPSFIFIYIFVHDILMVCFRIINHPGWILLAFLMGTSKDLLAHLK